jgi:hypothetical protein
MKAAVADESGQSSILAEVSEQIRSILEGLPLAPVEMDAVVAMAADLRLHALRLRREYRAQGFKISRLAEAAALAVATSASSAEARLRRDLIEPPIK